MKLPTLLLTCAGTAIVTAGVAVAVTGSVASAAGRSTPAAASGTLVAPAAAQPSGPFAAQTSVFTAVTPCRLVDTRRSSAGALRKGADRTFRVAGSGFASQGGSAGNCSVPAGAVSVAVTLTAVSASNAGYLQTWAAGTPSPGTSTLQFQANNATSAGFTVPVSPTGFTARTVVASNQLVVDVTGYYAPARFATVGRDGSLALESGFASAARVQLGTYQLLPDVNLDGCAITVSPTLGVTAAQALSNAGVITVHTYELNNGQLVPGDGTFTVTTSC